MPLKAFQTGLKEHATINLDKQQFSLKAGDTALIRISIDIEKGWHAYDLQQNIRNKKSGSGIGPSPTLIKFSSKNIAAIGRSSRGSGHGSFSRNQRRSAISSGAREFRAA